jgi:hypothetical protein
MKKKSTKIILEKNITKKENTKEIGKKPCEEKLYQSILHSILRGKTCIYL